MVCTSEQVKSKELCLLGQQYVVLTCDESKYFVVAAQVRSLSIIAAAFVVLKL